MKITTETKLDFPEISGGLQDKNAHPRDKRIQFFEEGHIYDIDGDRDFVSCTTFIHQFCQEFDADAIIKKMMASRNWPQSKYHGMTKEAIKKQWSDKGTIASLQGTLLHAYIEYYYNDWTTQFPYPIPPEVETHFQPFSEELLPNGYVPYRTEWFVFDEEHRLAGSIDMTYQVDVNDPNKLVIYDWKRSCKLSIKQNRFQQMKPPLQGFADVSFWHYAMQLNIYRRILETKYDKTIEGMFLVGLHPDLDEPQVERVPLLETETEAIFQQRRKQLREM